MRDLCLYKNYIWDNSLRDLRNRYAGSSLGVLWNILQPLFQILIFTFVFSQIMLAKIPGMESTTVFAVYLCSGLLPWGIFSEIIVRGSNAFIENATYLKKMPVPEYVFICQIVVSSSIVLFITMSLLFVVILCMGGTISLLWLLLPIVSILFISIKVVNKLYPEFVIKLFNDYLFKFKRFFGSALFY